MVVLASLVLSAALAADSPPAPYRLRTDNGRSWFVDPNGHRFWSFAVDCVDTGVEGAKFDPNNPAYSADRLFASHRAWAANTASNLHDWGFNSLGGWSDADEFNRYAGKANALPHFEVLHLGAYAKIPWDDIFQPSSKKAMVDAAKTQIEKLRNDPFLAGYFSDNEIGWWGDTLFTTYLGMPLSSPGKQRIMAVIKRYYKHQFDRLQKDWLTNTNSFDELAQTGKMKLKPGGEGMQLVNAWLSEMGTYYYALVHDAIRAYDKNHLILGDRYCQFYELPIVEAAKPYVDAISTNFGATWNDGIFAHFFLDTLHRITDKPVIVTEFYMGATENRSGNKNTPAAFPVVQTQRERARAFERNVQDLAALPYVVGAHWFQFYDEPPKGRGDGENFNHGLVDIYGKPYEEMVAAAKAADPDRVHAFNVPIPLPRTVGISPGDDPMGDLRKWNRHDAYVEPTPGPAFADMYAASSKPDLYLSILAMDYLDESLYENNRIPEEERSTWTIRIEGRQNPIVVHFGGKNRPATVNQADIKVTETPALQHRVTIRVPLQGWKNTTNITQMDSTLTTHSRAQKMEWHRTLRMNT